MYENTQVGTLVWAESDNANFVLIVFHFTELCQLG